MDLTLPVALGAVLLLALGLFVFWPHDDTWRLEDDESYEIEDLLSGWRRKR